MAEGKVGGSADPQPKPTDPPDGPGPDPVGEEPAAAATGAAVPEAEEMKLPDASSAAEFATFVTALKEAVAVFGGGIRFGNVFLGSTTVNSAVGGDVRGENASHVEGARIPGGLVLTEHLQQIADTFVPPERYPAAAATLRGASLLLLRAEPGWGRTTAALNLLAVQCSGGVCKLEPDVPLSLAELPWLEAQHGYLLDALDPQQAAVLHPSRLGRLAQNLRDAGAMMVVLLDAGAPIREDDLRDYLIDGGLPAPASDVVRSHLLWQLRPLVPEAERESRVTELLADEQVSTLVAELSGSSARELVEFAVDLARAHASAGARAGLADRYSQVASARFADWFDGQQDIEQRALVIALAVFHTMPLHVVTETARMLSDRIREVENPDPKLVRRSLFGTPLRQRLAAANAELVTGTEATRFGRTAVQLARFRNGRLPRRVLEHVWHEHDQAHEVVRGWLRDLGIAGDPAVRARAGVAVGLLSLVEFDHVRQLIIEPWADSGVLREQQAAIAALQLPGLSPELGGLVGRMLADWLGSHQPIERRVAAVAALGSIGVVTPERTLRQLRRAVRITAELIEPAASSLTQLFLATELRGSVLETLLRWSVAQSANLRRAGHLAALRIAAEVVVESEGAALTWPAMVWLADQTVHRADIVTLFGLLIDAPFTGERTYRLLHRWAWLAGRDEAFVAPLSRFLDALVAETSDPGNLRFYLTEWREETSAPVAVLDQLIASIDGAEITDDYDI